ncbi:Baeyer-Villiger monooxygenase [Penicillium rolfsii]|nr:Baeyer-Villiger monooxygenase [Penicillium rolfsii]
MDTSTRCRYPVLIIGAGISGIAAACQLKEKLGLTDFLVLEQQDGIGGTWWSHRYPGVACDVPAPLYSYSFAGNPSWSTFKPSGSEIQQYLVDVCEKFQIWGNIQTKCTVTALDWSDSQHEWTAAVLTPQGWQTIGAKIVITAVGKFGTPQLSILEGLDGRESFNGTILHSAQWGDSVQPQGQRVTVIGGGCSAVQIVSELVGSKIINNRAHSVTQVIRSPHWVAPSHLSGWALNQWERYMPLLLRTIPGLAWIVRSLIFMITDLTYLVYFKVHPASDYFRNRREQQLLSHLHSTIPTHYADMLTPSYPLGCKRVISDVEWLKCLHSEQLQLYNLPLARLEERAVILRNGSEELRILTDILVLATGYQQRTLLQNLRVTGRGGTDLHQMWQAQGGPQAYLTLAVDKFPNLFMLYGPNTSNGHTSVIVGIENAISYIIKLARPIIAGHIISVEPQEASRIQWTRKVQGASMDTVWVRGGCSNWYIGEKGFNAMAYPYVDLLLICIKMTLY